MSDSVSSNELLHAAKALCDKMPTGDGLRYFHAGDQVVALRRAIERASHEPSKTPYAWVIPGDDNADMTGFIAASVVKEGEFTKPLYERPVPTDSEPKLDDETAILRRMLGAAQARIIELEATPQPPITLLPDEFIAWECDRCKGANLIRRTDKCIYCKAQRAAVMKGVKP